MLPMPPAYLVTHPRSLARTAIDFTSPDLYYHIRFIWLRLTVVGAWLMQREGKAKYREIYEHIQQRILSGRYAIGQQIPTETQLATQFDASRVTVARALRDLKQDGFLLRRRGAGSFVRQLPKATSSNLLGLITGDTPGLFAALTNEMVRVAQASNFGLLASKWPDQDVDTILRHVKKLCEQYLGGQVQGVFFTPTDLPRAGLPYNAQIAESFRRSGIPVVLLDRDVADYPFRSDFDLVGIDNCNAGLVLAEHLLQLGHVRIGFVSHAREVPTISARIAGYRHALLSRGLNPEEGWLYRGDTSDRESIRAFLRGSKITAAVCVNDHEAAILMRTLAGLGLRVPDDLAIVAIDDDQWATFLSVSLTTLRQPFAALGAAAIEMMLERLAQPQMPAREVCLACELIVRQSCGSPESAAGGSGAGSEGARGPETEAFAETASIHARQNHKASQ